MLIREALPNIPEIIGGPPTGRNGRVWQPGHNVTAIAPSSLPAQAFDLEIAPIVARVARA
jgi:hypothetical protein